MSECVKSEVVVAVRGENARFACCLPTPWIFKRRARIRQVAALERLTQGIDWEHITSFTLFTLGGTDACANIVLFYGVSN